MKKIILKSINNTSFNSLKDQEKKMDFMKLQKIQTNFLI